MAYPGYGAGPGGVPAQDPLYGYFSAVAGQVTHLHTFRSGGRQCSNTPPAPPLSHSSSPPSQCLSSLSQNKKQFTSVLLSLIIQQDGQISADELQRCLTQSGISGSYQPFSLETCRLMINMLDRDMSCSMGFNEFRELWQALNGWKNTFTSFDRDHSGTVEGHELQQAIVTMGYNLSPQAMNCIMKRYSINNRIPFDEFVSCCVRLRALTDQFRRRDTTQTGSAAFQYDDFIQVTMSI